MLQFVEFNRKSYKLVITDHALKRMKQRGITRSTLIEVLEFGDLVPKGQKNKFWVYKMIDERKDNFICASISIEDPMIVVITTLINWRPK